MYYELVVKFTSEINLLPNPVNGTPSKSDSLFRYACVLKDGQTVHAPFVFSVSEVTFVNNVSSIDTLIINNYAFKVNATSPLDTTTGNYRYWLIFELWSYQQDSGIFEYTNKYTQLQLNMTQPANA
jgi:hypothetical protein